MSSRAAGLALAGKLGLAVAASRKVSSRASLSTVSRSPWLLAASSRALSIISAARATIRNPSVTFESSLVASGT
jgi:hypothetical protein